MPRTADRQALVLLVEDNPANQLLVASILDLDGTRVVTVGNSYEARRAIRESVPDLILMDVQLPGGDGLELTREFKADPVTAKIPVIAITANAMPGDREAALAAGCADYIAKPIETRVFRQTVRRFLMPETW